MKFLAAFFLILFHQITSPSQEFQVSDIIPTADTQAAATVEEDVCNFLFDYYGIDPRFKLVPKDVQYQVCKHLTDYCLGVLMLKPFKQHEETESIKGCTLSSDNTKLAYCLDSGNSADCVLLNFDESENPPKKEVLFSLPICFLNSQLIFNADNSKILWNTGQALYECDVNPRENSAGRKLFETDSLLTRFPGPPIWIYRAQNGANGTLHVALSRKNLAALDFDPINENLISIAKLHPELFKIEGIESPCPFGVWFDNNRSRALFIMNTGTAYFYAIPTGEFSRLFSALDDAESFIVKSDVLKAIDQNFEILALPLRCNKRIGYEEFVVIYNAITAECKVFDLGKRVPFSAAVSTDCKYLIINSGGGSKSEHEPDTLELYHIQSKKRIGFQKKESWGRRVGYGAARFSNNGNLFITAISVGKTVIEFFKKPTLLTSLEEFIMGRFTIDQYLLCIFLRELRQKNTTLKEYLPVLASEKNIELKKLKKYFSSIFLGSSSSIKRYFYFIMTESAIEQEH